MTTTTVHIPDRIRLVELQRLAFANGLTMIRRKDGSYEMQESRPSTVIKIDFKNPANNPEQPQPAA